MFNNKQLFYLSWLLSIAGHLCILLFLAIITSDRTGHERTKKERHMQQATAIAIENISGRGVIVDPFGNVLIPYMPDNPLRDMFKYHAFDMGRSFQTNRLREINKIINGKRLTRHEQDSTSFGGLLSNRFDWSPAAACTEYDEELDRIKEIIAYRPGGKKKWIQYEEIEQTITKLFNEMQAIKSDVPHTSAILLPTEHEKEKLIGILCRLYMLTVNREEDDRRDMLRRIRRIFNRLPEQYRRHLSCLD